MDQSINNERRYNKSSVFGFLLIVGSIVLQYALGEYFRWFPLYLLFPLGFLYGIVLTVKGFLEIRKSNEKGKIFSFITFGIIVIFIIFSVLFLIFISNIGPQAF